MLCNTVLGRTETMMKSGLFFSCLVLCTSTVWALSPFGGLGKTASKIGRVQAGPIQISSMGAGTWSWGNRLLWDYDPSEDESIYESYRAVRDAGITVFDTADSYGTTNLNGRAEILLGQFEARYLMEKKVQQLPNRKQQQVATKFAPYPWRLTRGSVVNAARDSLNRLGQSKLAIAQLHWSTANYQPFQEGALWNGIADVYDEGLADAVGVSNYGPIQLRKFSSYMNDRNVPLATAQVQYSLMTYKLNKDSKEVCDDVGCRLISYSPLCLGLLTGKYTLDNLPRAGNPRRQLFRELLPGAQELLSTLRAVAKEYGKSQTQVAINWAICKDTVPIPGIKTLAQAEENIGAASFRLRSDAVDELDRAAINIQKPMIQNIFQTK